LEFTIEAFTHKGTHRKTNEDAVLIHDDVLKHNKASLTVTKSTRCFVADGVGGSPGGDQAAQFTLERLMGKLPHNMLPGKEQIHGVLHNINNELIQFGQQHKAYEGLATTLAGIAIYNLSYCVVNVGDSVVMLHRKRELAKLFNDQVMPGGDYNIPISNYFGGFESVLNPKTIYAVDEIVDGDIFLVATDGIFKVFSIDRLNKVLSNSKSLKEKSEFLLYKALQIGSPDNITCVLIEAKINN